MPPDLSIQSGASHQDAVNLVDHQDQRDLHQYATKYQRHLENALFLSSLPVDVLFPPVVMENKKMANRCLDLSACILTPKEITDLIDCLKTNTSVTKVIMWHQPLQEEDVEHIAEMLTVNNIIETLWMDSCGLTDVDCSHLSKGLEKNIGLRHLSIGGKDHLTDEHIQKLCTGLALNKGMETLDLWCEEHHMSAKSLQYLEFILTAHNFSLMNIIIDYTLWPMYGNVKYLLMLNQTNEREVNNLMMNIAGRTTACNQGDITVSPPNTQNQ